MDIMQDNPPEQDKIRVYQSGKAPAIMTSAELSAIALKSVVQDNFPRLCHEFEKAATYALEDRFDALAMGSNHEDLVMAKRYGKVRNAMCIKEVFYFAGFFLAPSAGIKQSIGERYRRFNYQYVDKLAGLLGDTVGRHRAAQLVPQQMRSQENAAFTDDMNMKNLSNLIRRSIAPN